MMPNLQTSSPARNKDKETYIKELELRVKILEEEVLLLRRLLALKPTVKKNNE
jgi:hypothetical protein